MAMTEYQALQSNYSLDLTSTPPGESPEIFWTLEIIFFVIYVVPSSRLFRMNRIDESHAISTHIPLSKIFKDDIITCISLKKLAFEDDLDIFGWNSPLKFKAPLNAV